MKNGIKIRTLNCLMIVSVAVICFCIIYSNVCMNNTYNELLQRGQRYRDYEQKAREMKSSSDNLTNQMYLFVQTAHGQYLEGYFEGVTSGCRTLTVDESQMTEEEKILLKDARETAEKMMQMEMHAIKLIAEARGFDNRILPVDIRDFKLSSEERNLNSIDKEETAKEIAFGYNYQMNKNRVDMQLDTFLNTLIEREESLLREHSKKVTLYIYRQMFLSFIEIALIVVIGILVYTQIIVILKKYVNCIICNEPLKGRGVYELRYLAVTYNRNCSRDIEQERKPANSRNVDALMGIVDKEIFLEEVQNKVTEYRERNIYMGALLIVDVDKFRNINETNEYSILDALLHKISELLTINFRRNDMIGKLSDERYGLWLSDLESANPGYIKNKIWDINDKLQTPKDGLPPISISVGAAFMEEQDDISKLYRKAEKALEFVKEHGRCDCRIYQLGD